MKVTILQSNIAKVLGATSRIVGARTTLPVLSNIHIRAEKGKIKFSATDLEVGITTQTIGKVDEEGEITLPARLLSDFVLNNKDESIEIITSGTSADLKSSHFEAKIQGIAAEEFPTIPEAPQTDPVVISKQLFIESLKKVAIAPATDETRPVLAGIYFAVNGTELILAATDSYRLAEKKIKLESEFSERKMIIPGRTMTEVLRILSGSDSATEIKVLASDSQVSFLLGDTHITSRLIEGTYPNYQAIIPLGSKISATVKLSELVSAAKMSSLFAKDTANNNVRMVVGKGEISILSAASQAGSAKSKIEAETNGGDIEISFNARYILDFLGVAGDDQVVLGFNDNSSAGVFKSKKDEGYTYIIMPLKLES